MTQQLMTHQVVTANDLRTGEVLYYSAAHTWTNRFYNAVIVEKDTAAEALLSQAQEDELKNLVVGVYAIDVTLENGKPSPVKFREQLRVYGPSIHAQFQKPVQDGVRAA